MIINTSRFGQVEIDETEVLQLTEGLLGFSDLRKFVLLNDPNDEIFVWLQSCEAPAIAFPVLEPELFASEYSVSLTKSDLESLKINSDTPKITGLKGVRYFSIVTIPDDPTQMTANLKAPIVINIPMKVARQCVLQDNHLAIREPIFAKLQQRVVANPEVAIKNQSAGIDVAIKINNPTAEAGL